MTGATRLRPFYKLILVALIGIVGLIVRFPNTFAQQSSQLPTAAVDYYQDIQPIFTANCAQCHQGPAATAELRLDSVNGLMKGGTSGPAIIPGSADNSLLVSRIADTGTNRMPPGGNLSSNDLALIRAWINKARKLSRQWTSPLRLSRF